MLYLLGDYIDRGPNSSAVLDVLMDLIKNKYQVFPLRGNHEEDILNAAKEYDTETFYFYVRKFKSTDLLDSEKQLKDKYKKFIETLPYYIELDKYILVHGGIPFERDKPYEAKEEMLVKRNTIYHAEKAQNKIIITGHEPRNIEEIKRHILLKSSVIPLDNGCVFSKPHKYYDYTTLGNLLCLNLDTFELISQKNIDH